MQKIQLGLRIWQFVFTLLTTSLIGNVIDEAFSGNSSSINYAMFVSVLCWVVLLVGLAAAFKEVIPGLVMGVLDVLATIFTFIAGVVLAAKLNVHSCGNESYIRGNPLTNGSNNPSKRCHELQASTAFYWFLFAAFAVSAVMSFMNGGGSSMNMRRGGGVRTGPSMSKV